MPTPAEGFPFKGVRDCAIFEVLEDSADNLSYDEGFPVTVQEFSMNPDLNTAELPGNDVTLDIFSKAKGLTGALKNAKIHARFLAILMGAQHGTSPTSRTIRFDGDDNPKYFKIAVKVGYTGSGSNSTAVILVYMAKLESIDLGGNQDDYWECTINYKAIPTQWTNPEGKNQICEITVYDSNRNLLS